MAVKSKKTVTKKISKAKAKKTSKSATRKAAPKTVEHIDEDKRDFVHLASGAMAAIGAGFVAWPFISQMNPSAAVLALGSTEVDISAIEPGQAITVKWRGKPVFIRNRTEKEVADAKAVAMADLKDAQAQNANLEAGTDASDANRSGGEGKENWIVMVGVCTHLGCIPVGTAGEYGGWFCPCHGSHYDTSGRIRKGPAPTNLPVPPYAFMNENTLLIGATEEDKKKAAASA